MVMQKLVENGSKVLQKRRKAEPYVMFKGNINKQNPDMYKKQWVEGSYD